MALEAVVFPVDTFGLGADSFWGYDLGLQQEDQPLLAILDHTNMLDQLEHQIISHGFQENSWDPNFSSPENETGSCAVFHQSDDHAPPERRRKRRRTKSSKNKEELEKQRMTHIMVERNRRKQMNEYLAVLRSFMPSSYVQRGDQASIVGGAINFVKELEQLLQTMEANKSQETNNNGSMTASPFSQFFSFPQYTAQCKTSPSSSSSSCSASSSSELQRWSVADIEVSMVESHAHLKILSEKRPKQLLKMVAAFQTLRLTILHLNVTTSVDHMVLYSVSVKVEEGCRLKTVEEIAGAVHEMLGRIQEETALNY